MKKIFLILNTEGVIYKACTDRIEASDLCIQANLEYDWTSVFKVVEQTPYRVVFDAVEAEAMNAFPWQRLAGLDSQSGVFYLTKAEYLKQLTLPEMHVVVDKDYVKPDFEHIPNKDRACVPMSEMAIGTNYMTRDGNRARIIVKLEDSCSEYPVRGYLFEQTSTKNSKFKVGTWSKEGRWKTGWDSDFDIISKYTKVPEIEEGTGRILNLKTYFDEDWVFKWTELNFEDSLHV